MAMAMPSFCQRTTLCLSNAKPIFKYSSVPPPNGPAMPTCKFVSSRLHHNITSSMMMWSTETNGRIRARKEFMQQNRRVMLRAVAEEEETQIEEQAGTTSVLTQSDKLTIFFQIEGTLDDKLVKRVTQALEDLEDVSNVMVETVEGITTIELVKHTTIQAGGVASALVQQLQGMDFKLHSLSLRVEDEEEEEEEILRRRALSEL
ncbi:hypothetical protein KI387_032493 [Taxus chinensis]|uniref:Uncharacterized protein n=1 Tax=Taxus chinensis TaxID=29808 RepID=A0AA38BVI9_TAXCH|nr:hypothetical protein KI387_032493 [Taxus chinensis]